MKLVVREPESPTLRRFLEPLPTWVSCALARVEVPRAVRLHGDDAGRRAAEILTRIRQLRLDEPLLDAAAALTPEVLRSLDAIHLAAAQALADSLEVVVTYDERLWNAGVALGLPVAAPGERT